MNYCLPKANLSGLIRRNRESDAHPLPRTQEERRKVNSMWATSNDGVPEAFRPQVTVYDETSGKRVATVFQAEAIPLIATAPELLAACEELLEMVTDNRTHGPAVYAAAEAIAKAKTVQS